jgi:hypothetical protein
MFEGRKVCDVVILIQLVTFFWTLSFILFLLKTTFRRLKSCLRLQIINSPLSPVLHLKRLLPENRNRVQSPKRWITPQKSIIVPNALLATVTIGNVFPPVLWDAREK